MLQQAYLARQNTEKAFSLLDEEIARFQQEHPTALSYPLVFGHRDSQELIGIASHLASIGYDVECQNTYSLVVDWRFAEEGRTGKIYIDNSFCHYVQDASFQNK